jgi:putative oxidoreductase
VGEKMDKVFSLFAAALTGFNSTLAILSHGFLLAARLYVAQIFFKSGLTKIQDFSSTIALFESEYKVPILSPEIAATLGTGAELVLPILLALGLISRPTAVALFVFNIVAVISYADISELGRADHVLWGALILMIAMFGSGKIALDHWISKWYHGSTNAKTNSAVM